MFLDIQTKEGESFDAQENMLMHLINSNVATQVSKLPDQILIVQPTLVVNQNESATMYTLSNFPNSNMMRRDIDTIWQHCGLRPMISSVINCPSCEQNGDCIFVLLKPKK